MIGAGKIAELHAAGYAQYPQAQIVAVADNHPGVAEARTTEWGAQRAYTDYRALLDDPNVDAVDIITPHNLHRQMTIDALAAGKNVSVQKPMALTADECDEMIEAEKRSSASMRVFENFRYYPPLVRARQMMNDGVIGEPVSLRIKAVQGALKHGWQVPTDTLAWRFDEKQSGGGRVVFDYGYHLFAIAVHLFGPVEQVFAWIRESTNDRGWVRDAPAIISWLHSEGNRHGSWDAIASDEMVVRSDYWAEDEWFEISGTRGFIWVNRCTGKTLDIPPLVIYSDGVMTEIGPTEIEWDWAASFRDGMFDFVDSSLAGNTAPLNGQHGKYILQFARAAQESARKGRPVTMPGEFPST
ncbi:MAG: Gfo/Idh/MocA family oxidoreductase [Dehalococcoidia bacterium]|nr:Gfo/Idh/MocA family oxidoreductase [Dehalococcoidia bacterium]